MPIPTQIAWPDKLRLPHLFGLPWEEPVAPGGAGPALGAAGPPVNPGPNTSPSTAPQTSPSQVAPPASTYRPGNKYPSGNPVTNPVIYPVAQPGPGSGLTPAGNGQYWDSNGRLVDSGGQPILDNNGSIITNGSQTAYSSAPASPSGAPALTPASNGQYWDSNGNLVDQYGTPVLDSNGQVIKQQPALDSSGRQIPQAGSGTGYYATRPAGSDQSGVITPVGNTPGYDNAGNARGSPGYDPTTDPANASSLGVASLGLPKILPPLFGLPWEKPKLSAVVGPSTITVKWQNINVPGDSYWGIFRQGDPANNGSVRLNGKIPTSGTNGQFDITYGPGISYSPSKGVIYEVRFFSDGGWQTLIATTNTFSV